MSISLFAPPGGATGPDPYEHRQWALGRIAAQDAWSRATGAGMTIAVIDTGVSAFHPEFAGKLHPASASWFSCPGSQVPCTDTSAWNIDGGHGTWVAGVAAASRNGEGIAGVAPDARIMALRAVGFWEEEIPESLFNVGEAIRYAVDHGADVINLSLGWLVGVHNGGSYVYGWAQAVQYAVDHGVFVAMAAGNLFSPICENEYGTLGTGALCVGATTPEDTRRLDSNWGGGVDLVAPGGGGGSCDSAILTTGWLGGSPQGCNLQNGYGYIAQTSAATPHVAGVAALLAQQGVRGDEAGARILATVDDLGLPGYDPEFGHGRLNAARAVGAV